MSLEKLPESDQTALRRLVQHVARAFYDTKHIVVLDQLVRHPVLKDDDLAGRLGLQLKELGKLMATLTAHKLVSVYRQNEQKEGALRAVGRAYFYLDYRHFCNVVKWRMAQMRRVIDNNLRNELNNKGYICPQCQRTYTPLEVDQLMDWSTNVFRCSVCQAELVDNEAAANVVGSQDRMQRFNAQMALIREGLKKSEAVILPAFDIAGAVRRLLTGDDKKKDDLKIAGADGKVKQEGLTVVMDADKDEATIRREREMEAAAKRQQNALPSWHLKSTISGDLTALGVAESSRTQAHVAAPSLSSKPADPNASLLRSLGSNASILNSLNPVHARPQIEPDLIVTPVETKPVISKDADYYDQYYASLAASASNSVTPAADSVDTPPLFAESEDRKPDLHQLNGRKRPREDGAAEERVTKTPRQSLVPMSRHSSQTDSSSSTHNSPQVPTEGSSPPLLGFEGTASEQPPEDDPMVMVAGKPMPYSVVTEEHHDMMTADEYTQYFELFEQRNML